MDLLAAAVAVFFLGLDILCRAQELVRWLGCKTVDQLHLVLQGV
jgi:hypothetical protein